MSHDCDCAMCDENRERRVTEKPLAKVTEITTKLYFECHVTVEPVEGPRRDLLVALAKSEDFRVAELVMRNGEKHRDDAFCSARSATYLDLLARMLSFVRVCRAAGLKVYRYKIENTLLDSKEDNDELELLK